MNRERGGRVIGTMIALIVIFSLIAGGCEPLRKKFTRQKKKDSAQADEFIPVLEPEEYPEKVYSPAADYKYHYSLWQVWHKELSIAISEEQSNKRQVYMASQMVTQVDALKNLVNAEKRPGFDDVLKSLGNLKESLERPAPMHDNFAILNQLRTLERKMRNNFSFDKVEESLLQY